MNIDLSKTDLGIIQKALEAYIAEPVHTGMASALMNVIFMPREERAKAKEEAHKDIDRAQAEQAFRRREVTLLQAKIIQAENRVSEFDHTDQTPSVVT